MPPSTPSDRAQHSVSTTPRRTLPPPEWQRPEGPRSAASLLLERQAWGVAVARRNGPRAELTLLFAQLEGAEGDEAAERSAATALARSLATRGTQLDVATRLARRALLLGDDPVLREELAGWFVTLGEPALAAATLRPLVTLAVGTESAVLLVRIGVLLARAGEVRAASEAFADAALADASDPVPLELQASLAAWAPQAVEPLLAAGFYADAADRREARAEKAAAFEDLLRGFELSPAHAGVAERLSASLLARGRGGAADEIRREHASALGEGSRGAHLRRMRQAVKDGDFPRALAAAFDASLDAEIDLRSVLAAIDPIVGAEEAPLGIDGLLERTGMHELLAARVELASDFLAGRERARARVALGRLYAGSLGRPDRALEAWIDALVSDPGCDPALEALRRHAVVTRDRTSLVEALIRVGEPQALGTRAEQVACLRELALLAEERLADPGLALWAVGRLRTLAPSEELAAQEAELAPRVRLQDEALAEANAELTRVTGALRVRPLSRAAAILAGRPDRVDAYLEILMELVELAPEERAYAAAAERVLARLGRHAELEALLTKLEARAPSGVERGRVRLALAVLRRRRGDVEGALHELLPLLAEPGAHGPAYNLALLLAAQRGDRQSRAVALARVAGQLPPSLRAVLLAVAAEEQLASGDAEGARATSEQACNADPSLARPAAARARVGVALGGRWGAGVIERAMSIVVPRPALSNALADILERLGEPLLAAAWAQRSGALRPGDLDASRARLARATASDDGARLADTLAWFLSQPQRLTAAAPTIAEALEKLSRLAPGRAAALARRALDVLGPRDPALRAAALSVADAVGERGLGIAAVERWLATGSLGSERGQVLLDLARRRKLANDADGAARALCRALAEGAPASEVLRDVDGALPTRSSDGEIALLQARAEALSALTEAAPEGTAAAWRELGAALWDLAGDHAGAVRAWERAAAIDPAHGAENFASDLLAFAGDAEALERLAQHGRRRGDTPEAARYYGLAAGVALMNARAPEAFFYARRTLEIDPTRSEAIAVAERAAGEGELDMLDALYDRLATTALGCFGERAVRYRAARQFERRGLTLRALKHAVAAFEAVPSEGVVLVTLARIAERSDQRAELVRAIERVAERAKHPELGAAWLRRAALLAGENEEGRRQRVEMLLRALAVRVDAELVRSLAEAMAELVREQPEERDAAELRFRRAARSVLARGEGPDGARVAIEVALSALATFGDAVLAVEGAARAAACDGDLAEFTLLAPHVVELASAPESAAFVEKIIELGRQRFASAGTPLLELAARVAEARGDRSSAARLLVSAVTREPDVAGLVERAEAAARAAGDPELMAAVVEAVPDLGRFELVLELAAAAERAGDMAQAIEALERARRLSEHDPVQRTLVFERSAELLARLGRRDELEALLGAEFERADPSSESSVRLAAELAALHGARGRPEEALAVLAKGLERVPDHPALLGDTVTLARQAGDRERQAWAIARLIDTAADPAQEATFLRELAPLLEALGDEPGALSRWSALNRLAPDDTDALVALERDAERRGDYEFVVRSLDRRAALAGRVDDVRKLRLRRATVLEQRLGRPDEARSALEVLVGATGDHMSVLRVLADLDERLGDPLAAAPLWLRASALTTDRGEAADLARRACQAYLSGGDVEGAHRTLEGMGAWVERPKLLELGVEIERRRENPLGLADALDELSAQPQLPVAERARLLVEAARAGLAGGDAAGALERAAQAARLVPEHVEAQLLARKLEYLARGAGSGDEARATIADLNRVQHELEAEPAELRCFLLAEALDRVEGPVSGLAELERETKARGVRPLLALGIAERLSVLGRAHEALEYFELALVGELGGLRVRSRVALSAGEAARRAGELERACVYLEQAALDPETQHVARPVLDAARAELASRAAPTPGLAVEELAPGAVDDLFEGRAPLREHVVIDQDEEVPAAPRPLVTAAFNPRIDAIPDVAPDSQRTQATESPLPLGESSKPASARKPQISGTFVGNTAREVELHVALADGSEAAGRELLALLGDDPVRAHDRVSVCRRLVLLAPGSRELLNELLRAARDDRNVAYAVAVEHVLAVLRGDTPPEPPPLEELGVEPEVVRALLFRETQSPTLEALALVWETAGHLFRRDPGAYGITGLERVQPTAPTPLARAYGNTARSLGALRTPLFQRRTAGPVTIGVALLATPSVVLSGDVARETPELAFHLGAMLAAASPQLVMLFGLPEAQARSVLRALGFAFGPSRPDASGIGPALNLAEMLWESIPARPQRRLRELCHDVDALDYDQAMLQARIAIRRAGMFAAGHFGVAVNEIATEDRFAPAPLSAPDGMARLATQSPSIKSLYQLALGAEYAETRWRGARLR
jgi:tetratricopeptide (TPR) repeat protein